MTSSMIKSFQGCEEESGLEAFPDDWNASGDVYALRYGHPPSSKRFLLKIVRLGDQLLLHLLVGHVTCSILQIDTNRCFGAGDWQ